MGGSSSSKQAAQPESPTFCAQEEVKKLLSKLGDREQVKPLIKKKTELDNAELNIAVTGEAGAGKSTFINAMRGLRSTDKDAAAVGTTETTMEPSGYPHPRLPNVRYWDLPGIGTTQFPAGKYLKEMTFERYDFFIIISACRFRENDTKLAKEIKRLGKNFYFVRSKIDCDLHSMKMEGMEINEEEELEKIRLDCVQRLVEAGIPAPTVFLISSFEQNRYDFIRLNDALEYDPPNVKSSIFAFALPNLSMEIVRMKSEMLKKSILILAMLSETDGVVLFPDLSLSSDIYILMESIILLRKRLGLDDASLQRLANRAGKSVEELKAAVKSPLQGEITPDVIRRFGRHHVVVFSTLEFVSGIGSVHGARLSFLIRYNILNDALMDLTENAERVVKVVNGTY